MFDPAPMVRWYDPQQLLQTAPQVAASTILGRHADHRPIEALTLGSDEVFDYRADEHGRHREDIWIDYVADTGDGWHSTYGVAYAAAQPELKVTGPDGREHLARRGDILIFGGDEVYPTPSRSDYNRRLVQPYKSALPTTVPPHPHVFAIPGNHDWYDSLVSFTRLFISKEWFAGWEAKQSRSYFALRLPHGWWLIGTDVQLGSDIDKAQVDYFRKVRQMMGPEDRIILCNAEPHWIYATIYRDYDATIYNEGNLKFLEEKVFGRRISVFIAGDLHHYRRHEDPDGRQKITAGGGGAFLHPTHGPDVSALQEGYTLRATFPDVKTSRCLAWKNLLFPVSNFSFGLFPAVLYVLTAWSVMAPIGTLGLGRIGEAIAITLRQAVGSPGRVFWALATFFGFVLFTDTHSKLYRWTMGPIHGLSHLTAAFLLGWGATYLSVSGFGWTFGSIRELGLSGAVIFVGGWLVGSLLMGIYLLVSLNVFGRHANEAFSSLASPDYKSFLRLRIDASGDLTVLPIGIQRVPRVWAPAPPGQPSPSQLVPADPRATPPALIEPPVVLRH